MLLNELETTQYNAFIKCFASHRQEKENAFKQAKQTPFLQESQDLWWLFFGLTMHLLNNGDEQMENDVLTPEKLKKIGQEWGETLLQSLPLKKRLAGLSPNERLAGLSLSERLAGFSPEEIEAYLAQLKTQNGDN